MDDTVDEIIIGMEEYIEVLYPLLYWSFVVDWKPYQTCFIS